MAGGRGSQLGSQFTIPICAKLDQVGKLAGALRCAPAEAEARRMAEGIKIELFPDRTRYAPPGGTLPNAAVQTHAHA